MDGGDICIDPRRLERLRRSMGEGIFPELPFFLQLFTGFEEMGKKTKEKELKDSERGEISGQSTVFVGGGRIT